MKKLDKSTYTFLKAIKKNNNKDWFTKNKPKYIEAKDDVTTFAKELMDKLNKHDEIEDVKVFRIYRDVRFSKDKTPYKTNIAFGYKRATAARRGGMYVNIEPGNSFVAGGFWGPNSNDLKRIRNEFVVDAKPLRKIMTSKKFKDFFGELKGEGVKTAPKGFDKNHENIDLIRLKQYLVYRNFADKEVMEENFLEECNKTFKAMRPFLDYMSEVLTTNENGESLL